MSKYCAAPLQSGGRRHGQRQTRVPTVPLPHPSCKRTILQLHSPLCPTLPHPNYNTKLYHTKGDYPPICFTQVDNLWITHGVQIGCICRCMIVYQCVSIRREDSSTKGRAKQLSQASWPTYLRLRASSHRFQASYSCSISLFSRRIISSSNLRGERIVMMLSQPLEYSRYLLQTNEKGVLHDRTMANVRTGSRKGHC
jgi:hypothetical protein